MYTLCAMLLNKSSNTSTYQIKAYQEGPAGYTVRINEENYNRNLIIAPHGLVTDWMADDFEPILNLKSELILWGMGPQCVMPDTAMTTLFDQNNISVEYMTTRAACHTFMILSAEGRDVAAALIVN